MRTLDRKLLREIVRLRSQAIAIGLVVACGVASFMSMRSAYNSLHLSRQSYYAQYRFGDVFCSLKRAPATVAEDLAEVDGVARIDTRVVVDVTVDVEGFDEPVRARIVSIPTRDLDTLNDVHIRRGRYPAPGRAGEVLVSEAFSEAHDLGPGSTIGAVLNGRWKRLRIVGVALSPEYVYEMGGGGSIFPDAERFGILWMNRRDLAAAFDMEGAFNDVTLSLAPGADARAVKGAVDRVLEPYGGLGAYDREEQVSHRFLADDIKSLEGMGTILPGIFLAVAAFLLHFILSRLIRTERDQIAILKAFGYDDWTIGLHYLEFVLLIVFVGSLAGAVAGTWMGRGMTRLYAEFYRFPVLRYGSSPWLVATGILVSAAAAIFGALSSVRKAVLLPPAEAMRPEPPPAYRATILERIGLAAFVGPPTRMILRNLERKAVHSALSILGISAAFAILILGRYFFDAVNRLAYVQFENVQREDVTVLYNEPMPGRVEHELAHLPGVRSVESFRSVSCRVTFGHRSERTTMLGLPADGKLRRLISRQLDVVDIPTGGAVLTSWLADDLGVGTGDRVTVQILEGDRRVRTLPVVGTIDEFLGVTVYVEIGVLNDLLGEGPSSSGANLLIDSDRRDEFNERVQDLPGVAGVGFRKAALDSFRATLAESMSIFTSTLVLFASIIAFAVIYNGARISLSERARELSTLRVLGFSQGEITYILLGEQAILTVAAAPLGFALGIGFASLMPAAFNSELFRFPVYISRASFAYSVVVVALSAVVSGLAVGRRLQRLDLVAVLKTRE